MLEKKFSFFNYSHKKIKLHIYNLLISVHKYALNHCCLFNTFSLIFIFVNRFGLCHA